MMFCGTREVTQQECLSASPFQSVKQVLLKDTCSHCLSCLQRKTTGLCVFAVVGPQALVMSDLEPYLHLGAEFPTEGNWCLVSSLQGAVKLLVSLSKAQKQLNHPGAKTTV